MQNPRKICRLILLGLILSFNCFSSNARAALVVDTGPGFPGDGGFVVGSNQWAAGLFTLNSSYTVNSVEGWIHTSLSGTVTSAIYTDSGVGVPVSELFSQQFLLEADNTPPLEASWDGASGLNWLLGPGDYWLTFEVRPGDTLASAVMPSGSGGAPNPLADYAFYANDDWNSLTSQVAIGMRIDADLSVVPVPATVWLFGTALIGLVGFSKRKKVA